jgi:hypothetical protein
VRWKKKVKARNNEYWQLKINNSSLVLVCLLKTIRLRKMQSNHILVATWHKNSPITFHHTRYEHVFPTNRIMASYYLKLKYWYLSLAKEVQTIVAITKIKRKVYHTLDNIFVTTVELLLHLQNSENNNVQLSYVSNCSVLP